MAGRSATDAIVRGRCAISVNDPGHRTPAGWRRVALLDVAELGTGHTPSREHPEYWDGDVAWIGIRDARVHHGGVILDTDQHVTKLGLANSAARLLPANTVCLSRTASVGYVVKMGREMATSQDFVTWTCSEALDPDFLMKALLAEGDDIRRFGEGSTHTTIYFPEVKAFHIDLPPAAEQRRIVAKLEVVTARLARARAELDAIPALVTRHKQRLLSDALSGNLTCNWRADRDQADVGEVLRNIRDLRVQDRRLSKRLAINGGPCGLPPSWAWVSPDELADDAQYSLGIGPFGSNLLQSDYMATGVRLIFVRDIRRGRFDAQGARYVSAEKAVDLSQHTVMGGEVLITKMGDPPGDTALYPSGAGLAVITSDCVKLKPDPRLATAAFLVLAIRADIVKAQLLAITAGVAQQKISLERFRTLALPVPPLEEQAEIARLLGIAFARADCLEAEAARGGALLDRLEASILAKAFKGELVPQDPKDEPASVLLERIKAARNQQAQSRPKRGGKASVPKAPREKAVMTKSRQDEELR
jgi:type I restriction enzyme S subunit